MESAEQKMAVFRELLKGYKLVNILNMDETALFYRTVPSRSYELNYAVDSRQQGRGRKGLQAKDRVTLVLCVNATGSVKIAPLMIGTSKKPRCFKGRTIPLEYAQQNSAWMDRTVYHYW